MQASVLIFEIAREADDEFDQIVRRREAQLLRVAHRMLGNWADAEDVAQDVFLRLHRHGLNFPNESALGAWLYRVAVNLCVDRSRHVRPSGGLPALFAKGEGAETEMLREEQKRILSVALAALPVKERAAVVLREIECLSTADVAAILGSSEGTVRSQVSRAMTRLRALLGGEER